MFRMGGDTHGTRDGGASRDAAAAVQRHKRRRLVALSLILVAFAAVYVSLPRSWFDVPDDTKPNRAKQAGSPSGSPPNTASLDQLRDAVEKAPLDFNLRSRYGIALAAAGKKGDAEAELLKACTLAPASPVALHNLGVLYLNQGDNVRADTAFARELEWSPADARAHYYRGLTAQRQQHTDAAIAHFRFAIALAPDFPDAYLALAIGATRKEPEEQIKQYVDRYIKLTGNKGMAYYVLSGAYRTWGRFDEAARYGEMTVAAEPKNFAYRYNLGQVYAYAKRTQEADNTLNEALKLARDPSTVLIELGLNAETARRFPDAIRYFQRALEANPKAGHIHRYLSRAYHQAGDEAASQRELQAFHTWERSTKTSGSPGQQPVAPAGNS